MAVIKTAPRRSLRPAGAPLRSKAEQPQNIQLCCRKWNSRSKSKLNYCALSCWGDKWLVGVRLSSLHRLCNMALKYGEMLGWRFTAAAGMHPRRIHITRVTHIQPTWTAARRPPNHIIEELLLRHQRRPSGQQKGPGGHFHTPARCRFTTPPRHHRVQLWKLCRKMSWVRGRWHESSTARYRRRAQRETETGTESVFVCV